LGVGRDRIPAGVKFAWNRTNGRLMVKVRSIKIHRSAFKTKAEAENASNYRFTKPKTIASIRVIALDSDTLNLLRDWKVAQQKQCKTNFILSYNGIPTQKYTVSHSIKRFAKAANIHRIKIHGLRLSQASLLISMGENPLVIKDRLGHEDIQMILGTYGHLYPNSNFQVADRLSNIIQLKTSDDTQIEHYS